LKDESIEGMSHDRVLYTFRTNIIGMFDLTRYAIPYMPKGSSIINVGSVQAYQPSPEILDYATTKAAIVGFTKGYLTEPHSLSLYNSHPLLKVSPQKCLKKAFA
jgi:NAD(P)-dependent dehydrogenase (short-subunit alcohol dehydrogenase family)